jgi:M6 family metalloprotease-like protein
MKTETRIVSWSWARVLSLLTIVITALWLSGATHSLAAPGVAPESQLPVMPFPLHSPAVISNSNPFAWILCKFSDAASEPNASSYYTTLSNNLNTYFKEVSYNKASIDGSTVNGWYTLPHPNSYYDLTTTGLQNLADDCTAAAKAHGVNFTPFYAINVTVNGPYGAVTWWPMLNLTGVSKRWPVTYISDYSGYIYSMGLVTHEMYHAFGLNHSFVLLSNGEEHGNQWDPVGRGACGFGSCIPVHLPSVQKEELGWIDANKIFTAGPGKSTVTLEQLAQPQTSNYLMAKIPLDTNHFYTVDTRRKVGYDNVITSDAVIIHERLATDIPDSRGPGHIAVISPSGQTVPAYPDSRWLVGSVFQDTTNHVKVTVLSATTTGFQVQIEVSSYLYLPLIVR